ncbi:MAG: hypothetical protein ACTSW2_02160, partial [Alphaproteobacteria bacterium]
MDRQDPSNSLESDLAAGSTSAARNPERAPAGSLMSIHIRRRTLPRDKPPVPSATPAPVESLPTAPKLETPAPVVAPVEAPVVAAPAPAHPADDPGRRMQSTVSSQTVPADPPPASPPVAAAVPAPAPASRTPLNTPGIARHARTGTIGKNAGGDKPHLAMPATKPPA